MAKAKPDDLARAVERALLEGSSAGVLPARIAAEQAVSVDYVRKVRRRLVKDGRLEQLSAHRFRPTGPVVGIPASINSTSELFEHLAKMPILSAQETMRYLSYLATSGPDTVKVSALKALEDLRRSDELRKAASASLPTTVEAKLSRLAIIREGVGSHLFSVACGCINPGGSIPKAARAAYKELRHAATANAGGSGSDHSGAERRDRPSELGA